MSQQITTTQIQGASKSYCYVPVRTTLEAPELGKYVTYGISVCQQTENGLQTLDYVADISTDAEQVSRLAKLFTAEQLDPIHVPEVIEDFLAS